MEAVRRIQGSLGEAIRDNDAIHEAERQLESYNRMVEMARPVDADLAVRELRAFTEPVHVRTAFAERARDLSARMEELAGLGRSAGEAYRDAAAFRPSWMDNMALQAARVTADVEARMSSHVLSAVEKAIAGAAVNVYAGLDVSANAGLVEAARQVAEASAFSLHGLSGLDLAHTTQLDPTFTALYEAAREAGRTAGVRYRERRVAQSRAEVDKALNERNVEEALAELTSAALASSTANVTQAGATSVLEPQLRLYVFAACYLWVLKHVPARWRTPDIIVQLLLVLVPAACGVLVGSPALDVARRSLEEHAKTNRLQREQNRIELENGRRLEVIERQLDESRHASGSSARQRGSANSLLLGQRQSYAYFRACR